MQRWREQYLGRAEFLPAMSTAEVDQFFTLSDDELAAVASRRGPLNRLSVGLQIGFLRMTGRLLNSCQILPVAVLDHLGAQLRLTRRGWRRSAACITASARCSTISASPWRRWDSGIWSNMPNAA